MNALRLLLIVILTTVVTYTIVVVANHGLGLFPIFFGDIAAMGWPGQFNLDFLGFLILAGVWIAWRHRFSAGGIALGCLVPFGGVPYVSLYLLVTSFRVDGDVQALLLGSQQGAR